MKKDLVEGEKLALAAVGERYFHGHDIFHNGKFAQRPCWSSSSIHRRARMALGVRLANLLVVVRRAAHRVQQSCQPGPHGPGFAVPQRYERRAGLPGDHLCRASQANAVAVVGDR